MQSISGSSIAGKYERELDVDVEARAREELHGGVLQRAFRDAEFEQSLAILFILFVRASRSRKHVRVTGVADIAVAEPLSPAAAPCRRRNRRGCDDLEPVARGSPFVHSALRVRLKNVAKPVARVRVERLLVHEADHQHVA